MKILIADDEPSVCTVMLHHIKKYGSPFSVCKSVKTGIELIEQYKSWKPDIVFADIRMPQLSGLQAITEIKEIDVNSKTSFYILSGYSDFDYARTAIQLQAKDYLLKPVHEEQIIKIMSAEEQIRYGEIYLPDAYHLDDEKKLYEISKLLRQISLLSNEGLHDLLLEELERWKKLAEKYNVPIDKNFLKTNFNIDHAQTWQEQYKKLKRFALEASSPVNQGRQFESIIDYINSNCTNQNFNLESLADYFGYSAQYLSVLFKKKTNKNFSQYIIETRIEKAKVLLTETDLHIKDIGARCGFSYTSYFIKVFSESTGVTPTEYRENL